MIVSGAIPVKEAITDELPSGEVKNPANPALIQFGQRKIPFAIHHNGKVKNFHFEESKSVEELHKEIWRLSCTSKFTISTIKENEIKTAVLRSLNLPSENRIIMKCASKSCQDSFNSEMLVTSRSNELVINEVRIKLILIRLRLGIV